MFSLLILARIIAALGASVGLMMTFTIVSDYYEPELARKKLTYVIVAFAVAPGALWVSSLAHVLAAPRNKHLFIA